MARQTDVASLFALSAGTAVVYYQVAALRQLVKMNDTVLVGNVMSYLSVTLAIGQQSVVSAFDASTLCRRAMTIRYGVHGQPDDHSAAGHEPTLVSGRLSPLAGVRLVRAHCLLQRRDVVAAQNNRGRRASTHDVLHREA